MSHMLNRESQVPNLLDACPGLQKKRGTKSLKKQRREYTIYAWVFKNPVKYVHSLPCSLSGNPSWADLTNYWKDRGDFTLSYTHSNRTFTAGRFEHVIMSYVHVEDAPRTRGTLAHCKWSLSRKVWRSVGGRRGKAKSCGNQITGHCL